nr:MAG TPA: hypothetical protein [Caudoviricetes sp.]
MALVVQLKKQIPLRILVPQANRGIPSWIYHLFE